MWVACVVLLVELALKTEVPGDFEIVGEQGFRLLLDLGAKITRFDGISFLKKAK